MTPRILFNFASKGRPQRAQKAIKNIQAMCDDTNHDILLKIDNDDYALDYYRKFYPDIVPGYSDNKVHAINRDIPQLGWDILVNMSDDIVWITKGFDNIIREHCGKDDFCLFPEPYADSQFDKDKNDRVAIVSIIGFDYYIRDGYVYHPSYKSLFCDNEAIDVARIRGRLKEIEIPLYYHEHPSAGYSVNDKRYCYTQSFWNIDKETYRKRKEGGFV